MKVLCDAQQFKKLHTFISCAPPNVHNLLRMIEILAKLERGSEAVQVYLTARQNRIFPRRFMPGELKEWPGTVDENIEQFKSYFKFGI